MVSRPAHETSTLLWPPDDTEESVVGVDRHQLDIITLRTGINEAAHRVAATTGGPLPWQAITQIMLLGCRRPDGSDYTVMPDVMVFPRPMAIDRGSYRLRQDGPPVLIVEVASESTYLADLDPERGKAWSYAAARVGEYLVLDPTGRLVPGRGRGWRLAGEAYAPWAPGADGRWQSTAVPLALGIDDGLTAVYDADGRRLLREGEVLPALAAERTVGRIEGLREAARQIARQRFGRVDAVEERIASADEADLTALLGRLLTATTPGDL